MARGRFFPIRFNREWDDEPTFGVVGASTGEMQKLDRQQHATRMRELKSEPIDFVPYHSAEPDVELVSVPLPSSECWAKNKLLSIDEFWEARRRSREYGEQLRARAAKEVAQIEHQRRERQIRERAARKAERAKRRERDRLWHADVAAEQAHPAAVIVLKEQAPPSPTRPAPPPRPPKPTTWLCDRCGRQHSIYQQSECPLDTRDRELARRGLRR
jgi:hypothetical protein